MLKYFREYRPCLPYLLALQLILVCTVPHVVLSQEIEVGYVDGSGSDGIIDGIKESSVTASDAGMAGPSAMTQAGSSMGGTASSSGMTGTTGTSGMSGTNSTGMSASSASGDSSKNGSSGSSVHGASGSVGMSMGESYDPSTSAKPPTTSESSTAFITNAPESTTQDHRIFDGGETQFGSSIGSPSIGNATDLAIFVALGVVLLAFLVVVGIYSYKRCRHGPTLIVPPVPPPRMGAKDSYDLGFSDVRCHGSGDSEDDAKMVTRGIRNPFYATTAGTKERRSCKLGAKDSSEMLKSINEVNGTESTTDQESEGSCRRERSASTVTYLEPVMHGHVDGRASYDVIAGDRRSTVFAFAAPIGEETTVDDSDNSIGISPAPHPGTAVHCTGPSTTLFDTSMFEDATPSRSSFTSVIGTGATGEAGQTPKTSIIYDHSTIGDATPISPISNASYYDIAEGTEPEPVSNPIHGGDAQGAIAGSKPSKYHKSSIVSFSGTGSAIDVLLSYAAEQNMSSIQEGSTSGESAHRLDNSFVVRYDEV